MDRAAVQPKKVPIKEGPRRYLSESSYNSDLNKSPTIAEPASNGGIISSPESAFTPVSLLLVNNPPGNSEHCNMPSSSTSAGGVPCFLAQQVEIYHEQRKRRRLLLCRTLEEMLTPTMESTLKGLTTINDLINVYNVQMGLMFEWAEKLEEFREIQSAQDKVKLLKHFSMKYYLLDNICHTVELNYGDRIILANNTYIQPNNYVPFIGTETLECQQAMNLLYGEHCIRMIDDLVRPMLEMGITYGEVLALRLIVFWNPGSIGLSPGTSQIVHKASEKAIKELHNWFDAAKIEKVQTRLGSVLLLLSPLSNYTQFLTELVNVIPGFGKMPEWDVFLSDLLR